jgi:hypothetical protein
MGERNKAFALRDLTGMGLMDCSKALRLSEDPEFGGDVVLAVCYVNAAGFAVNVRGDRHAYNLSMARSRAPGDAGAQPGTRPGLSRAPHTGLPRSLTRAKAHRFTASWRTRT